MNIEAIATGLAAPAVTALATAGVVWVRESLSRRDRTVRRREALSNATQEVQFIQAYLAARRELDPDERRQDAMEGRVRRDLAEAYALVEEARVGATLADRERLRPSDLAASVFLWGKLASPWAKAGLVVHYYLLTMVLTSTLMFLVPAGDEISLGASIATAVFALAFSVGVVWLWRRFLLWLDRRLAPQGRARPPSRDITTSDVAIEVWDGAAWMPGRLVQWRREGDEWVGRVRLADGSSTGWVPSARLRYPEDTVPQQLAAAPGRAGEHVPHRA